MASDTNYRLAVLFAGRGPLLDLRVTFGSGSLKTPSSSSSSATVSAYAYAFNSKTESESESGANSAAEDDDDEVDKDGLLHIPAIHVHGLRDPGLSVHRDLVRCCADSNV
ncbi:hypothetical protein BDW74DRAFT_182870 [Aspergillus multicolor]|uniref:uncharacterized protein n=1 Tax=Aspergillus multicolor TaxID=41759 RepID=UPI003CCDC8BF